MWLSGVTTLVLSGMQLSESTSCRVFLGYENKKVMSACVENDDGVLGNMVQEHNITATEMT